VHDSTLRSAESLQAKAAVEKLKAGGSRPGGRAKRNAPTAAPAGGEAAVKVANETPPEDLSPIGRLASTLGGISSELSDILTALNSLKSKSKVRLLSLLTCHNTLRVQ
jgi:hypothetical protein